MTLGTWLFTWWRGERVGGDDAGNRYFRDKRRPTRGRARRWVLYAGEAEASRVPAEWHAWLHHTLENPLTEQAATAKDWQKPHLPNLTGTEAAYRPSGHDLKGGTRAPATGDYEAWSPE